ncbi:MAG: TatD family deoxyribonuclease [Thermotoga sp.]|nr:MAG: TatD family deoxyribonuclease [Thermotoga sp.]
MVRKLENPKCEFVDTHAHLHMRQFDQDREDVIANFERDHIRFVVEVGVDIESSLRVLKLSEKNERIFSAVGVHPHDVKILKDEDLEKLEELGRNEKVVAIGEIGLDFYRNLSPRDLQEEYFVKQIEIAKKLGKPIIVHVRDAYEEAVRILRNHAHPNVIGVVHSFSGDYKDAKRIVEMGFKLGIGGPVTFKNNEKLREIVRKIDLKYILSETDCPYLTPHPFRGKRNEPRFVRYVVEKIALLKGKPVLKVAEILMENAIELFGLDGAGMKR